MTRVILVLLGVALTNVAYAGGYRVALQGQKALGMGHTGVALSDSSEAIFFNPGAITRIEADTDITGGITLLTGETLYQNAETNSEAKTDNPLGTPINLYMAQKLSDEMSWGLGIYTPFGNKVEWPTDWQGSHLVNYIELQAIYIQPTIAYKINETTSVGFGPTLVLGSVEFNRNLSSSLTDADGNRSNVTIKASNVDAFGFNLGVLHSVSEQLDIGASYRSEVTIEARNESADFENIPTGLQGSFPDGDFDADLVLPAELTLGVGYQLNDKMLLAFDFTRTYWGAYKELKVEFDAPGAGTSINPRNYKDSNVYRFGVQYQYDESWVLRGGIYLDESPVRNGYFAPETPRNDSIGYTAGASYQYSKNLELDISLLLLTFDEIDNSYDFYTEGGKNIPFGGTYDSAVTSVGFGLSYQY
ncbi:MAG: long-chain fatty acid transport protein [Planctomycetota bacterium]|jgi:long-chain fatty acid transport protein